MTASIQSRGFAIACSMSLSRPSTRVSSIALPIAQIASHASARRLMRLLPLENSETGTTLRGDGQGFNARRQNFSLTCRTYL
jgi:hypothetical protein